MAVLTATGAGARIRRRWVFRDLDLEVEPGETVAITGPPGSGRTTALLALTGRFRLAAGTVRLGGTAALAYVPEVSAPEPALTVAEHVRERRLLVGGDVEPDLHGLDPGRKGWQLSPYERHLLGLSLATQERPALIALDGIDDGLNAAEQDALWELIQGHTVLITARDTNRADRVVEL
jgi:ABC-2 type transport system ATP-binding protein